MRALWSVAMLAALCACAAPRLAPAPAEEAARARYWIDRAVPRSVTERAGWVADLYAAFILLQLPANRDNACAVAAVIEQESGFRTNPAIPGLPKIAWREIDRRAALASLPPLLVHGVLQLSSPTGHSYAARIDAARTEKELSDVYEDLTATVPLGRTLFAGRNPIRTRGPMQVQVGFAERYATTKPYPYPIQRSLADELFTRRGGVYFGVAHLLDYSAPYDAFLYRFADFNAGRYASRNAAFQNAVAVASGIDLVRDGALLAPADEAGNAAPGATEIAVRALFAGPAGTLSAHAVHDGLLLGKTQELEQSALYRAVYALAERRAGHRLPPAMLPTIELKGPKISRKLTTAWYAGRVESRFEKCTKDDSYKALREPALSITRP